MSDLLGGLGQVGDSVTAGQAAGGSSILGNAVGQINDVVAAVGAQNNAAPTRQKFASDILSALGIPQSQGAITALLAWMQAESGASGGAAFNPLNTTMPATGATAFNDNGGNPVKNYPDYQTGLQATVATLKGYPGVLQALRSGDPNAVGQAVASSPWGTGNGVLTVLNGGKPPADAPLVDGGGVGVAGAATATPAAAPATPPPPFDINAPVPTDPNADSQAQAAFPQMAWALKDPQISNVLRYAAKYGMDSSWLQGELQKTSWYQTHSQSSRAWTDLSSNDPAEAKSRTDAEIVTIRNAANIMGVNLTDAQLSGIATSVLANGLDQSEVNNLLGGFVSTSTPADQQRGATLTNINTMRAEAAKYMVPVSDQTLNTWAQQIDQGANDLGAFTSYLQEQAKSLFPGMAAAIDAGVTPQQYTDPYKQVAAQTLQVNPDSINMMDPKWSKALFQVDPKTGARTSMSLNDWQNTIRSDPSYGYQYTSTAKDQAYAMVQSLGKTLGAVA